MAETPTTNNRQPKTDAARQRQRDGQYKGLLHAAQKRKADNSANYATNFDHGQMASDFERSAEAAGETREEVRGHLSLLDRTLLTLCGFFPKIGKALPELKDLPPLPLHTDASSPRAPKLGRALALLLWRPLRLFCTQQNWEQLAICYRLQQVRDWRQKHPDLTVEQVEKLYQNLYAVLENYLFYLQPRLERIEKRFWKVWGLYRALVGVVGLVFGTRDSELPIADCRLPIEAAASGSPASPKLSIANDSGSSVPDSGPSAGDESPIENRQSAIGNWESAIENRQSLVQFRGTPHYDQFHPSWEQRIDDLSPEMIADCFQSPSHASRAQRRRAQPAAVKDPKDWQEHPPKPRLPEMEFTEFTPSEVIRTPSERELRRLVRKGELTVPGSFEDFAALVEEALGTRDSGPSGGTATPGGADPAQPRVAVPPETQEYRKPNTEDRIPSPESRAYLHALAESLWDRMHVFSARVAELRELLEATLVWEPNRFLQLWLKLLPVEQAYNAVGFFNHTHGPNHADVAWGEDEPPNPRRRTKLRPYITPRSEAEGRQKHAGELQPALRLWLWAVDHALVPALRGSHKVTVALYDWAVSRFGIREEFLQWRPELSLAQRETRRDRPEWAVRVVTVTGKTLVKLRDGQIFEPEK